MRAGIYLAICFFLFFQMWAISDSSIYFYQGNGHSYQRIDQSLDWGGSKNYCEALGGHLATVTSRGENLFIFNHCPGALGGTDKEAEGGWRWVTGEPWGYENWADGEPNNQSNEDYLNYIYSYGEWNDVPGFSQFVCEWDDLYIFPGTVTHCLGAASISSAPAQIFDTVSVGNVLETGAGGYLSFVAKNSISHLLTRLDENTELKILGVVPSSQPIPPATQLECLAGKIQVKLDRLKQLGVSFVEIITPTCVASVRGTELIIEVSGANTIIIALEDAIEISSLDRSQSIVLNEGHSLTNTTAGLGTPFPIDVNQVDRWWAQQVTITATSLGNLLVIDPIGRRIGTTAGGDVVNEISTGFYTGSDADPEQISIIDREYGGYEINFLAMQTGDFNLNINADTDAEDFTYNFGESVVSNQTLSYHFELGLTHYVDISNSTPTHPYVTLNTAATNIQDAVDVAYDGDTVLVNTGTYVLDAEVLVTNNISIQSLTGSDATLVDGNTTNRAFNLEAPSAQIGGFTVTNSWAIDYGGGIRCSTNQLVSDCRLIMNQAAYGAGMSGGIASNCVFIYNDASAQGGGLYDGDAYQCLFFSNTADSGGGVSSGNVYSCTITDNSAVSGYGGGVNAGTAYNSIIYGNDSSVGDDNIHDVITHYSCSPSLIAGSNGNIMLPPIFIDESSENFHLSTELSAVT